MRLALITLCLGLVVPTAGVAQGPELGVATSRCAPLPWGSGEIIDVSTEDELRTHAYYAATGTTIRVAPGVYHLGSYIHIINGVTIRGATGNRDDVILDLGGMVGGHSCVYIDSDDVTLADLTIRNAADHCVQIQGRDGITLYNLHLIDAYDQLVKVNPRSGAGSKDGLLACCLIEYSSTCPNEYTNGISAHDAHRWTVRDNVWRNIRTPGNTPCPVILFWSGSSDTVVERNLLIDCFSGIAFGNASHNTLDHTGGVVRNNVIVSRLPHDVAVEMVHASGWLVAHNTAYLTNPYGGLNWGMEARYGESDGRFVNNLTNMRIWLDRNGASATSSGDVTNAEAGWFVDAANADLHLRGDASQAVDQVSAPHEVLDDMEGDARPQGARSDVGADEVVQEAAPTTTATPSPTAKPTARPITPVAVAALPMIWH